jgi:hypothetical protein
MDEKYQYRFSRKQKESIAQNLIDIVDDFSLITKDTRRFISEWIRTGPDEKRKAFYDVWDIVLRNYMPKTMPVLFRSCKRVCDGKIASFTGRLKCADRMGEGKGLLIICDTKEWLQFEERMFKRGEYKHTFYPLIRVLEKGIECGEFPKKFWKQYLGEDEYIMRVSSNMHSFRWKK